MNLFFSFPCRPRSDTTDIATTSDFQSCTSRSTAHAHPPVFNKGIEEHPNYLIGGGSESKKNFKMKLISVDTCFQGMFKKKCFKTNIKYDHPSEFLLDIKNGAIDKQILTDEPACNFIQLGLEIQTHRVKDTGDVEKKCLPCVN